MNKKESKLKSFVKKHKKDFYFTLASAGLTLTGFGVVKVLGSEPQKYSSNWFKKATDKVLETERELIRQQYCSSGDNFSLSCYLQNLLNRFDKVMSERAWDGKKPEFPVHREHGWYLPNDD